MCQIQIQWGYFEKQWKHFDTCYVRMTGMATATTQVKMVAGVVCICCISFVSLLCLCRLMAKMCLETRTILITLSASLSNSKGCYVNQEVAVVYIVIADFLKFSLFFTRWCADLQL